MAEATTADRAPPPSTQIVRADLRELVDLDLKGAPYAYAPMGSDREETKGFRFWDSGYWKDHLKGRPYHIRCELPRYSLESSFGN